MPARATPADYQTQAKLGHVIIGAEFTGHGIPNAQQPLNSEDYVAVEVGLFGAADARLTIGPTDFSLRINGKKDLLPSQPWGLVAKGVKDLEWVSPDAVPGESKSKVALLKLLGCDAVWLPRASDIYPDGFATTVTVSGVSERWDGETRPGYFAGVATVVAKLLIAVQPDVALFGEKDFQQLAVIRRMVIDLGLPVAIVGVPTVRDTDGLALSSRNAYLTCDERQRAVALPQALDEARAAIESGEHILVSTLLAVARAKLVEAGFAKVDYLALVDAATLEPLDHAQGEMRLIAAATIGSTRLIDNIRVEMATLSPSSM